MVKSSILAAATHITRRAARRRVPIISAVLLISLLSPLILYTLLGNLLADDPRLVPHAIRNAKNVLLITAHPDDGPLFFGPSMLQSWGKKYVDRHVLVLSAGGNSDGLAEKRRTETKASCAVLGVPDKKCLILENKDLQGDAQKPWDEQMVERALERHVKLWNIDLIITFDNFGISGHPNHRAVSDGVGKFSKVHEHNPAAYALQTKSVLRRYMSLADLVPTSFPFTFRILEAIFTPVPTGYGSPDQIGGNKVRPPKNGDVYGDKALIVSDWRRHLRAQEALKRHVSGYSWDTTLYSMLSRYMWFNDLRRM